MFRRLCFEDVFRRCRGTLWRRDMVAHAMRSSMKRKSIISDTRSSQRGKLFCECCEFDFQLRYGDRGHDFIEAHHSIPIARSGLGTNLRVTDLRMVCANCHRMLHRTPWMTVRELQKELRLAANRLRIPNTSFCCADRNSATGSRSPDLGSVIPLNAARTPIDILMGPAISLS